MAEGIRIHHPILANCTLMIPHPGEERVGQPNRPPKDYTIRLDENGDCIVSETIWMRLTQARDSGLSPHDFTVVNTVANPPAQGIGQGGVSEQHKKMYKQIEDAIQEIAPPGIKPRVARGGNRNQQG